MSIPMASLLGKESLREGTWQQGQGRYLKRLLREERGLWPFTVSSQKEALEKRVPNPEVVNFEEMNPDYFYPALKTVLRPS